MKLLILLLYMTKVVTGVRVGEDSLHSPTAEPREQKFMRPAKPSGAVSTSLRPLHGKRAFQKAVRLDLHGQTARYRTENTQIQNEADHSEAHLQTSKMFVLECHWVEWRELCGM